MILTIDALVHLIQLIKSSWESFKMPQQQKDILPIKKKSYISINMINQNLSDDIIIRCTGLEKSTVAALKKSIKTTTKH